MENSWIDLITDENQIIRIECPTKFEEELWESVENCMKQKCWWSPSRFDGCKAELNGLSLERVAMWKIIGTL